MGEIRLALTTLERDLLEWTAASNDNLQLQEQIRDIEAVERLRTNSGFFTTLRPSRLPIPIVSDPGWRLYWLDGPLILSPQMSSGAMTLLSIADGYLHELEVVSLDTGHPMDILGYSLVKYF